MSISEDRQYRYFVSYSGMSLPLKLTGELEPDQLGNRNTYFRACYDVDGRVCELEKLVYGEVEMRHCYHYDAEGRLQSAEITDADGEVTNLDLSKR